jgi:hypothetical protein
MNMRQYTRIAIAIACALGVTAASAQMVVRDGKEVKPAQTRAPVKVAQTSSGGEATGGATGGAAAGGVSGGVIAAIAVGVAVVAVAASGGSDSTSAHSP